MWCVLGLSAGRGGRGRGGFGTTVAPGTVALEAVAVVGEGQEEVEVARLEEEGTGAALEVGRR